VWIANVDDGSLLQLTRDVREDDAPVWSADGRSIAFVSDRGMQTDVWIVPAAGGQPRRVTDDAAVESDVQWVGKSARIAFTTPVIDDGLWTRSLTDTLERRITPDSMRLAGDGWDLSPDGRSLVFQVLRGGGVSDIDVIPVAGGAPRVLVSNGAQNSDALWSPDGSQVVYVSDRTGRYQVWMVDASGGAPRDLTSLPGAVQVPQWSKDGTTVYFVSARDLWAVPAAGGAPRQLTHLGRIIFDQVDPASGTVFVEAIGGSEGQLVLDRLSADGALKTVWDRTSVFMRGRPFSPSGDSVFVTASGNGPGTAHMLLPTSGGAGRSLSGPGYVGQLVGWSHDGGKGLYMSGPGPGDLFEMNIRDGSTRRLTHSRADDGFLAFFLPGDTGIVFQRQTIRRRIAVADVAKLMAEKE
jgi:Tol biopolymer transport system component